MDGFHITQICLLLLFFGFSDGQEQNPTSQPQKCYEGLGCLALGPPWQTITRKAPDPGSREEVGTTFYLFNRNVNASKIKSWPEIEFETEEINFKLPVVILTHGFYASIHGEWVTPLISAYLEKRNVNLVFADWRNGAAPPNYFQAASNTRVVAREITRLLRVFEARGTDLKATHCVGHSLGAHTCGYVGKEFKEEGIVIDEITGGNSNDQRPWVVYLCDSFRWFLSKLVTNIDTVRFMTGIGKAVEYFQKFGPLCNVEGLDAAQPLFETADVAVRLNKGDATFVTALHTDAVPVIPFFGLGIMRPIADVDFYFNGRKEQPGCIVSSAMAAFQKNASLNLLEDLTSVPWQFVAEFSTCSHTRACYYYAEAIKGPCVFWGQEISSTERAMAALPVVNQLIMLEDKCTRKTCTPVGFQTRSYPYRGSTLVRTDDEAPFCDPLVTKQLWTGDPNEYHPVLLDNIQQALTPEAVKSAPS